MLNILFVKNDNRRPSIMEASFSFTFCVILYVFFLSRVKKIKVQNWVTFFEAKKHPPLYTYPQKTLWGIEGIPPLEIRRSYHLGYEKILGRGDGRRLKISWRQSRVC